MTVSFTAGQVKQVAEMLDKEWDSADDAARALLDFAVELVADRQKFLIIAQRKPRAGEDPEASIDDRTALAWFSTESQADQAGRSLAYNSAQHEEFRWWKLPVSHGTASDYHKSRKKKKGDADQSQRSYFQQEVQRRVEWCRDHPGQELPEDMRGELPLVDPLKLIERP